MSIRTTIGLRCDYAKCTLGPNDRPVEVSWVVEEIQAGLAPVPDEAKKFVTLELNGQKLAFCGKMHAAKFFLPETYEIQQKTIVEFSNPVNG
jgi:hypothetical protein